jgi:hypothetical protein
VERARGLDERGFFSTAPWEWPKTSRLSSLAWCPSTVQKVAASADDKPPPTAAAAVLRLLCAVGRNDTSSISRSSKGSASGWLQGGRDGAGVNTPMHAGPPQKLPGSEGHPTCGLIALSSSWQ